MLEENIDYLISIKNKFRYLGYFQDEESISTKIEILKELNNTVRSNLYINKNVKDNA